MKQPLSGLKRGLPSIGKFGLWLGISALANHLSNDSELTDQLKNIGLSDAHFGAASEMIKGLAAGKLSDYYKEFRETNGFGINNSLQSSINQGITHALDELRYTFLKQYLLTADEEIEVKFYFTSLTYRLVQALDTDEQIELYITDRFSFFQSLLSAMHKPLDNDVATTQSKEVYLPILSHTSQHQLINFIIQHLESYIHRYINEEFKLDEKARASYFIHVLEVSARINSENKVLLQEVIGCLDSLSNHHRQHVDILRQLSAVQEWLQEQFRKFTVDFRYFVRDSQAFQQRIAHQFEPTLILPNPSRLTSGHLYTFGLRYTTFLSRYEEMEAIWQFFREQSEKKFLWWLLAGPGGMGKSRLALEFCRKARFVKIHAGFLNSRDIQAFSWYRWRPEQTTFIVIDYVTSQSKEIRTMLTELSQLDQEGSLSVSVRVLLIDREVDENGWWAQWSRDNDLADSWYYPSDPNKILSLPPLTSNDRWQIIVETHTKRNQPVRVDKDETLQQLESLDPMGRPLYAFFVGIALSDGQDIRHWNVHDLLSNLLNREEEKFWHSHPTYFQLGEGHKNLLFLATLTRGLWRQDIVQLFSEKIPGLPSKLDTNLYESLGHITPLMKSSDNTVFELFEGLQPDLLGEYFVLKHTNYLLSQIPNGPLELQALLQKAWQLNAQQTWWMIWQSISDFPSGFNQPIYDALVNPRPINAPKRAEEYWAKLVFNVFELYRDRNQIRQAEQKYGDIVKLFEDFPGNRNFALQLAMAAYNLILTYSESGNLPAAENSLSQIVDLNKRFSKQYQIALYCIMGALKLINTYVKNNNWQKAEYQYIMICGMVNEFPNRIQLATYQAIAAHNLAVAYSRLNKWIETDRKYDDLRSLVRTFTKSDLIASYQARVAYAVLEYSQTNLENVPRSTYISDLDALLTSYKHSTAFYELQQILVSPSSEVLSFFSIIDPPAAKPSWLVRNNASAGLNIEIEKPKSPLNIGSINLTGLGIDTQLINPLPSSITSFNKYLLLDGEWQICLDKANEGLVQHWYLGHTYKHCVHWPDSIENHLKSIKFEANEYGLQDNIVVWYERMFSLPSLTEEFFSKSIFELTFGACGYETRVWLNGHSIHTIENEEIHFGENSSFSYELPGDFLRPVNRLTVRVVRSMDVEIPRGKQESKIHTRGDSWHQIVSGPIRSVWLEAVNRNRLRPRVGVVTEDIQHKIVRISVETQIYDPGWYTLRIKVHSRNADLNTVPLSTSDFSIHLDEGRKQQRVSLEIVNSELWSTLSPHLYDLTIQLIEEERVLSQIQTPIGIRKIEARGRYIYLNNESIYLDGILYQPGEATYDEIKRHFHLIKLLGCNMVRIHNAGMDPRIFHIADEIGLLLWVETPSPHVSSTNSRRNHQNEFIRLIAPIAYHPSVVIWNLYNEGLGAEDLATNPATRQYSMDMYHFMHISYSQFLVVGNDGWHHVSYEGNLKSDLLTAHIYTDDLEHWKILIDRLTSGHFEGIAQFPLVTGDPFFYRGQIPLVISEWGGFELLNFDDQHPEERLEEQIRQFKLALRTQCVAGDIYAHATPIFDEQNGIIDKDSGQLLLSPGLFRTDSMA